MENMENGGYSNGAFRCGSETVSGGIENDVTEQQSTVSKSNSNGSAKLVSSIYLVVITMLGLLMPLQDAVVYTWLETVPNIVLLLYLPIVSTVFLLFAQFFLQRSDGPHCVESLCNKCPLSRPPTGEGHNRARRGTAISAISIDSNFGSPDVPAVPVYLRRYTKNNSDQQQDDGRLTTNMAYIACRSRAGSMVITDQQPGPLIPLSLDPRGASQTSRFGGDAPNPPRTEAPKRLSFQCVDEYIDDSVNNNDDDQSVFWMDLEKLGNLFSHQGSSVYLRIGAMAFGIGYLIYLALEIEHWVSPPAGCRSSQLFGWTFIFRLIFIIVQTCIVFKNTKVQIVRFQRLAHFGYKHVIATNLCLWLHTLIHEVVEELKHTKDSAYYSENDTTTPFSSTSTQQTGLMVVCKWDPQLLTVSRYLFPFVLEYSLIVIGALTCIIYTGIEPTRETQGHLQVARGIKNFIRVFGYTNKLQKQGIHPNNGGGDVESHPQADDHATMFPKSHTGLFVGLLSIAGVVSSVVLFYFANGDNDYEKSRLIYWVTDVVLQGCLLLGCCLALVLTRNMAFVDRPISPDDFLLFLSMTGSIMFEMSVFITFINNDSSDVIRALALTSACLGVFQTCLQTAVIMHAMRRYPITANDVTRMPGRGTFTFLIIGNLAAWIQRTMQVKELARRDWESSIAWLLVLNIGLPLLLFYRFHSSVCFADVWHVAYTPLQHEVTAATSNTISPTPRSRRSLSLVPSSTFQEQQSRDDADGDRQSEESLELPAITVKRVDTTEQRDDVTSSEPTPSSSST